MTPAQRPRGRESAASHQSLTHPLWKGMEYLRIGCDELKGHMIYLKATTERGAAGGGGGGEITNQQRKQKGITEITQSQRN